MDCYKHKSSDSLDKLDVIDYCLFITFFPQLIAGPIVHHKEMMPQFARLSRKSSLDNHLKDFRKFENLRPNKSTLDKSISQATIKWNLTAKGLFIFALGLFKKVCIADNFAKWANEGFRVVESGGHLNIFESWATSLSYTFELYFDFSGYCDMAIGLGLLFDIMLPINFNSPYKALNITDFWRRWHITLGKFLKDYVYIPLGGNRLGSIITLRNLFIVAFLSGIWHGAGWGFVIWGVLHGLAMCGHRIYMWWVKRLETRVNSSLDNHLKDFRKFESLQKFNLASPPKVIKTIQSSAINTRIYKNNHISSILNPESSTTPTNIIASEATIVQKPTLFMDSIRRAYLTFMHTKVYTILCWFLTFNFINITWVFFRAENVQGALNLLKGMFGGALVLPRFLDSRLGELKIQGMAFEKWLGQIQGDFLVFVWICGALILCVWCRNTIEIASKLNNVVVFLAGIGFSICLLWLITSDYQAPFLYFNF